MQKLWKIFSVGAVLLVVCRSGVSAETNSPLSFYVVSDEKVEGGRFIDTNGFPKLGYIRAVPDLVITKLKAVAPTKTGGNSTMVDLDGKITVKPVRERPAVWIAMYPEDAKKVETLTEKSIGKQVLLMLGDTPLIAPRISEPISTAHFQLVVDEQADQKRIEDALKKLVTSNEPVQQ